MHITPEVFKKNRQYFLDSNHTTTYVLLEELLRRQYTIEMPYWPIRVIRFTTPDDRTRTILEGINQNTPALARLMSNNKFATYSLAAELGIPTPDTEIYETPRKASSFWDRHEGNCIVKAINGLGGSGVWTVFDTKEDFLAKAAQKMPRSLMLVQEKSQATVDVRLLFIGSKLVAATARRPLYLTGDGISTIAELLASENASREQSNTNYHHTMKLTILDPKKVEERTGRSLGDVLADGESLQASLANTGGGGIAEDVTDNIHPDFITAGSKIDDSLKCPLIAVDFLCDDPSVSFAKHKNRVVFLETNTGPGIGQHRYPNIGKGRDIASEYIDYVLDSCDR